MAVTFLSVEILPMAVREIRGGGGAETLLTAVGPRLACLACGSVAGFFGSCAW